MGKPLQINLIGLPWPINILQCSRQIDAMQPGDELAIVLADNEVKESLIQFLLAIPDLSFNVSNTASGYSIAVSKNRDGFSAKPRPDV